MEGSSSNEIDLSKISLRRFKLDDIDDFMVWETDKKVTAWCSWEPCSSKEQALNILKNCTIRHPWDRAICLDGKPIGAISVTRNSRSDRSKGELGYVLGSKYWGKGIATQAVKLVIDVIFKKWKRLGRLEAFVDVDNGGSQRVLEKAGFRREVPREDEPRKYAIVKGRTREFVMYSLLSPCQNIS